MTSKLIFWVWKHLVAPRVLYFELWSEHDGYFDRMILDPDQVSVVIGHD